MLPYTIEAGRKERCSRLKNDELKQETHCPANLDRNDMKDVANVALLILLSGGTAAAR